MSLSPSQLRRRYFWDQSGCAAIMLLWVGAFGGTVCAVMYGFFVEADRSAEESAAAFRARGKTTVGRVTRKNAKRERIPGNRPVTRIVLTVAYTYTVEGGNFRGNGNVSSREFDRLSRNGPIPVQYLPEAPGTSRIAFNSPEVPMPSRYFVLGFGAIFGTLAALGVGIVARAAQESGRRARLVLDGSPSTGSIHEVESVTEQTGRGSSTKTYLHYQYYAESDNAWHDGRSPALPVQLWNRWSEGDSILVLYDPANPECHEVDLYEVRPEDLEPEAELEPERPKKRKRKKT